MIRALLVLLVLAGCDAGYFDDRITSERIGVGSRLCAPFGGMKEIRVAPVGVGSVRIMVSCVSDVWVETIIIERMQAQKGTT